MVIERAPQNTVSTTGPVSTFWVSRSPRPPDAAPRSGPPTDF